jgi:hypothetical protein
VVSLRLSSCLKAIWYSPPVNYHPTKQQEWKLKVLYVCTSLRSLRAPAPVIKETDVNEHRTRDTRAKHTEW